MIEYPDSSAYEPIDIYAQRQQRIDERRALIAADRESRLRERDLSMRIRRGEIEQELAPYSPPQPQIPPQPEPPNPIFSAVLQGLEYLNRPGQAVRSALAAPLYGQDMLQAASRGLQGMSISPTSEDTAESTATILENRLGMGAGPSLGPINARGALGFGLDIAFDPLSYVPVGNIAKAAKGAKLLDNAPARASLGVAEEMARIKPNPIVSAIQNIPKVKTPLGTLDVGGIVAKPFNIIDPRLVNNSTAKKAKIAYDAVEEGIKNTASRNEAILRGTIEAPFETMTPKGVKPGINTLYNVPGLGEIPTGDVMQQIHNINAAVPLKPKQMEFVQTLDEFRAESKRIAKEAGIEFPETKLPESIVPLPAGVESKTQYAPRFNVTPPGEIIPEKLRNTRMSSELGQLKKRPFITQALGIEKGQQYIGDPIKTEVQFRSAIERQIAAKDFLKVLEENGVAHTYNQQAISEALSASKEAQVWAKQAQDFKKVVVEAQKTGLSEEALSKLESIFPDYTQELRDIVASGNKTELGSFLNKTRTLVDEAQITAKDLNTAYRATKASEKAAVAGMQKMGSGVKDVLFKNVYFKPEEGAELAQLITQKADPFAKGISELTAIPRVTSTVLDLAYPMLQGLPAIAMQPHLWGIMIKESIKSLMDEKNLFRLIAKERSTLEGIPNLAMVNPDFIPESAGALKGAFNAGFLHSIFPKLQSSFETAGIVARVGIAKSLYPIYAEKGKLAELGDFVNRATGVFSSASAGISPTQRAWESAAFFAPQYLRASLALVGYLLSPTTIQGRQSAKLLATMMSVGPAYYTKVAHMMGQEPNLDPSDPRFLSVQVGHDWIGVGSIWTALARLTAKSLKDPQGLLKDSELEPNPLLRFWRSRSSPTASTIWDVMDQKTYLGTDLNGVMPWTKDIIEKFAPFTATSFLLQNPPSDLTTLPALIVGARQFQISQTERLDLLARENYQGRGWNELSPLEQTELRQRPEAQTTKAIGGQLGRTIRTKEAIFKEYNDNLESAAQMVVQGTMTRKQFRDRQQAFAQTREDQLNLIEKTSEKGKPRELDPRELERKKYLSLFEQADPITGQVDFDAAEEYLLSLPTNIQTYIQQKQEAGIAQLPETARILMSELLNDRRRIRPYWDIWRQDMQKKGLYSLWQRMNAVQRETFKNTQQYKDVESQARQDKQAYRIQNPAIDALLNKWGYTSTMAQDSGATGFGGFRGFRGL